MKAAELLYKRLYAGSEHVAKGRVHPPTLLVRAKDNPQAAILGYDYGLSKVGRIYLKDIMKINLAWSIYNIKKCVQK